jgi:anti-sigma B factor antagonist
VIVSTRHAGKIAIVHLLGKFTLGPALRRVKPQIDAAMSAQGSAALILNLAGVSAMDSAGLGELVTIHTSAARRGVPTVLASVSPRVLEMFAVTRLDGIFTVCSDDEAAVEQLRSA